ncbi:MAG TPA: hypothetical protein VLG92_04785 [Candidatus Saccharimonadia bacterium]|nr:hypothetical protein [Candidatus Saccharimonadia bacterium]
MHVIEPRRYQEVGQRRTKKLSVLVTLSIGLFIVAVINYCRPLPQPIAKLSIAQSTPAASPVLAWPNQGQASVAAEKYGLLGTHGTMTPLATASIAKVITALCVLSKQPLTAGQNGPAYAIGPADVAIYQNYLAVNGSLIPVAQGEKLTEYQALEALMIPSANNIADSLVRWVFGSQAAYKTYATQFLQTHGFDQTQIGPDASGFDPSTVSTASDLAGLGQLALKNPVLLEIAGKRTTSLPVVGTVYNYDTVLGVHGITGLKTGNNDSDPGAFLFTANTTIGDTTIPITGAVIGAPDLTTALRDSTQLVASVGRNFSEVAIASAGQTMGQLTSVWGASATIVAKQPVQLVRWSASAVSVKHQLNPQVRSGKIGNLTVSAGHIQKATDLMLAKPLPGPSFWWRLTRH